MIINLIKDHIVKHTPTCGEIRKILPGSEYSPGIASALDIRPTTAHFHQGFDELYSSLTVISCSAFMTQALVRQLNKTLGQMSCVSLAKGFTTW